MRGIKLKAFIKELGEIHTVSSLEFVDGEVFGIYVTSTQKFYYLYKNEFELIFYTGLKDVNGREIYEGDLLFHKVQGLRKVEYGALERRACFALVNVHNGMISDLCDSDKLYEVVGNIYENPELLEGDA